jgi:hypothetical protein
VAEHRADDSRRDVRQQAWALIATIAEPAASVRERRPFASHGHAVRLTLIPATTP